MSDTPVAHVRSVGRTHIWGGVDVSSLFCVPVYPGTCPEDGWFMETLSRSKLSTVTLMGDLTAPPLESHSARYIGKVSFLHVTPGTVCKTDVEGHRLWNWTASGSDPAPPFQLCDLGEVPYPLLTSVSCGQSLPDRS